MHVADPASIPALGVVALSRRSLCSTLLLSGTRNALYFQNSFPLLCTVKPEELIKNPRNWESPTKYTVKLMRTY